MINKKHIYLLDVLIIGISLAAVLGIIGYTKPLVIAPLDDTITSDNLVLFEFEKAKKIMIDDNLQFSSPEEIYVENNLIVNLKPGKYYWKVEGTRESEIRELTILSEVDLQLREKKEKYEVINAGNTKLDVEVYENGSLKDKLLLDIDESRDVKGEKFIGEQNG
jgi:hypothetical protein